MITYHLGIDQAYQNTGFAVLEYDEVSEKLSYSSSFVFHPTIKLNQKSEAIGLLEHLFFLKKFISKMHFDSTAMEDRAFAAYGQASTRGAVWAIYATTLPLHSPLTIVSPLKVKFYATGSGKAEKKDVRDYVYVKYGLGDLNVSGFSDKKLSYDESDAVVIAEIGFYANKFMTNGLQALKGLTDYQKEILISEKPSGSSGGMQGICKRVDEFYIPKRSSFDDTTRPVTDNQPD